MSKPEATQRTGNLLARIDNATDQLLNKFSEIVELSGNNGKDRGRIASETFQIETNASTIVRAAEDLLFVTRSLKEAWILGQIKPSTDDSDNEETIEETREKADKLLDAILE